MADARLGADADGMIPERHIGRDGNGRGDLVRLDLLHLLHGEARRHKNQTVEVSQLATCHRQLHLRAALAAIGNGGRKLRIGSLNSACQQQTKCESRGSDHGQMEG